MKTAHTLVDTEDSAPDQMRPAIAALERFNPAEHYGVICEWWTAQKWSPVPLSHLPQTGLVVVLDGRPAAAAWIYKTDSAFCWLEWIVADPSVRREARTSALSVLISGARVLAQSMGFQSIFMSIRNQSLGKRLEVQGFSVTDLGMTNYVCDLSRG